MIESLLGKGVDDGVGRDAALAGGDGGGVGDVGEVVYEDGGASAHGENGVLV